MSASNWVVCPRCVRRAREAEDAQRRDVAASYGKIAAADYEGLVAAIQPVLTQHFITFREDYEIFGADTGTVTVDYGGECEVCGLSLSFKDQREIPDVAS